MSVKSKDNMKGLIFGLLLPLYTYSVLDPVVIVSVGQKCKKNRDCPKCQYCSFGRCADKCDKVRCKKGRFCRNGKCWNDPQNCGFVPCQDD